MKSIIKNLVAASKFGTRFVQKKSFTLAKTLLMPLMKLCLASALISTAGAQLTRQANTTMHFPASLPQGPITRISAFPFTFTIPVGIANAPGDSNSVYIVEKGGKIFRVSNLNSTPKKTLFLDITSRTSQGAKEEGLLGLAFHPNYQSNGLFYVFYVTPSPRMDVLSQFTRISASAADPASEKRMIVQKDDATNHNAGDLHFGSDGYLYVTLGDEGAGDGTLGNTQLIDKDFFSAMMRIDVDRKPANLEPNPHTAIQMVSGHALYKVPADNPFVNATKFNGLNVNTSKVRTEFWAVGLRNPWRFSIDAPTGRIFVGDVGQSTREEIDLIVKGGNYGWNFREGTVKEPKNTATPPAGFHPIDPIYDYGRSEGSVVMGGLVYRGDRLPELKGLYIYADYGKGAVRLLRENPPGVWKKEEVISSGAVTVAFGTDPTNNDLLMADDGGAIWRLVRGSSSGSLPAKLSDTGAFASLADLSVNPGIVGFEPKVTFWSDQAKKTRWFSIPDVSKKMTFATDSKWTFPAGSIWIKHFNLLMDRRDPSSAIRLETRFLVKTATSSYGLTYRWNAAQTDATLLDESGADQDFNIIDENGVSRVQRWHFPSRAECLQCHTDVAGSPLGFNTRQLNTPYNYGATTANQLTALKNAGYFSNTVPDPATLPTFAKLDDESQSQEFRVRTYLAVNCSQCHQPGAPAPTAWDARASVPLLDAHIVYGTAEDNGGVSSRSIITPGSTANSVLLSRISASDGFTRMPPIATAELDQVGMGLISNWINNELKSGLNLSINSGGSASGKFVADAGYSGGSTSKVTATINTSGVQKPAPQTVYQSNRKGAITYKLGGLTLGRDYLVRLHFAETAYSAANKRVFNVKIGGVQVLTNLDVFTSAGGKNRAMVREFIDTPDANGQIVIQTVAVTDKPFISGIECTEYRDSVLSVNAGGGAAGGFVSDTGYYSAGAGTGVITTATNTAGVTDAAEAAVYKTYRSGQPKYTLSGLQAGKSYKVLLHFVESSTSTAGNRVFDIKVNGSVAISNLDIIAETGAKYKALVKQLTTTANASGQIIVQPVNKVGTARISGLEIRETSAPSSKPVITSSNTTSVKVNGGLNYQITASNTPTSFGATGLPPGISVNSSTGLITGTTDTAGTYNVTILATNSSGTGSSSLAMTVLTDSLAAPTHLTAVLAGSTVQLSWSDNSSDETYYKIFRKTGASGSWLYYATMSPNTTSFTDTNVTTGTEYSYKVFTKRLNGGTEPPSYSPTSNIVTITLGAAKLTAPSNLNAIATDSEVTLTWIDHSPDETSFRVWRMNVTDGENWLYHATLNQNSTSYVDTQVTPGKNYIYRIKARKGESSSGALFSDWSNEASVTVEKNQLAAPSNLKVVVSSSKVTLTWTDLSSDESSFRLRRMNVTDGGTWQYHATLNANQTQSIDTNVQSGKKYRYHVRAAKSDATGDTYSDWSNEVTAVIP